MLKSKKIVDWLYNYSLYFIIGALLLVIIAIEPSFVRVSNFTTIGVIIFQIISYGLIYIGVSPDLQYVVKGLIIIVAVVLDNQKSLRKAA